MKPKSARPIVVLGSKGQLGTELCQRFGGLAKPFSHDELDITSKAEVTRVLTQLQPSAVINAAGYTEVDKAERDRSRCWQVNADAVRTLAGICTQTDSLLVQISTDFVFGGDRTRSTPYTEDSPTAPVNVYGQSKVAGEKAARSCPQHLIVRTCGLYSASPESPTLGRNFPDTMLHLASQGQRLQIVNDQRCTPSSVEDVSDAIANLIELEQTGTFHLTNQGDTTWHGFAVELFRQAQLDVEISPVTSAEYPSEARRPAYSVLNTSKFASVCTSVQLLDWQDSISRYLAKVASSA